MNWRALSAVVCLMGATPCSANMGGYITGHGIKSVGAFSPLGLEEVEMLSERLEIDLHLEYAEVRIEYVLHNPGGRVKVRAGFPVTKPYDKVPLVDPVRMPPVAGLPKLEDFALTCDGEALPTTVVEEESSKAGSAPPTAWTRYPVVSAWYTAALDFKKGQTRRVSLRFRQDYARHSGGGTDGQWSLNAPLFDYIFSSAAAWKGPIKQGSVVVRAVSADGRQIQFSHPKRFVREGDTWQWNFADLEPTLEDDMQIQVLPSRTEYPQWDEGESAKLTYVGWGDREDGRGGQWEMHRQDYTVVASSTHAPEGKLAYDAKNVANGNPAKVWVEGAAGDGIGESLTLTLARPANLRRIGVVNGYAESDELYLANNRVAELDVSVNGGKPFRVKLPDERLEVQRYYFDLPDIKEPVKTVKLTIAGVHKGTSHDDTCLSEVVLVVPLFRKPKLNPIR